MVKMNKFNKKKKEDNILDYMDTIYDENLKEAIYGVPNMKKSVLYNASVTDNGVPADKVFKSLKEDLRGFHTNLED